MKMDMFKEIPLWTYDVRQQAIVQRAAIREIMFREREEIQPNALNSPRQRQGERNGIINRQNNRAQNVIPAIYNPYDPQVNQMQLFRYFSGHNGFVYNDGRGNQQLQYNNETARGYNFIPNVPPMINRADPATGVFNIINPTPCFCDAYIPPNANLDMTACDCDVCLRLCRNQPLHVCILNSPPPPDCNVCGSPRNFNYPHNCNVCYPIAVVCCEEVCMFNELTQHMHHGSPCNNPLCRPRPL